MAYHIYYFTSIVLHYLLLWDYLVIHNFHLSLQLLSTILLLLQYSIVYIKHFLLFRNKNIIKYLYLANTFIDLILLIIFSHNNNCFVIILPIIVVLYFVQSHFGNRQTACFLLTRIKVLSSNLSLTVNDFISIWLPHGY